VDWLVYAQQLGIGNTPLKRISNGSYSLHAKLEYRNRFGSIKDRPAFWMLWHARQSGELDGRTILEPTSGNTGIALAGIAREWGYNVQVIIPKKINAATKDIIRSYNVEILESDDDLCPRVKAGGTAQSLALAQAMVKGSPGKFFMPNQYENEANFMAHYESTGPEIWRDTDGKITHLITGVGTGGTTTGTAAYLKEKNPRIKVIGVIPANETHILQGLRFLSEDNTPAVLERRMSLVDEIVKVSDEMALRGVQRAYREAGEWVGPSSGAVAEVAREILHNGDYGVVIFADNGTKNAGLYREKGILTDEEIDKAVGRWPLLYDVTKPGKKDNCSGCNSCNCRAS
jgi:S-sulfo-L-cysteine synthase (O-acetyl-L-serine-dependent)